MKRFLAWLFGCSHATTTNRFSDREGEYVRCCECGARIAVALDDLGIKPPKGYPKLRPMKARRGTKDAALAKSMGVKL